MNTLVEFAFTVAHGAGRVALVHDCLTPATELALSRPRRHDHLLGAAITDDVAGWHGVVL